MTILQSDPAPQRRAEAGFRLAASRDPRDHEALAQLVNSDPVLLRLNPARDYANERPIRLRVARIVRRLAENDTPSARASFGQLCAGGRFPAQLPLQELLVRASELVRPPPAPLAAFWGRMAHPECAHLQLLIAALCANGTPEAMQVLGAILLDPKREPEWKRYWMRGPMLQHRNGAAQLALCARLLPAGVGPELARTLLEAICDYDRAWYAGCYPPQPPPRALLEQPARRTLRALLDAADGWLPEGDPLRASVARVRTEISGGDLDMFRPGAPPS